MKCSECVSPFTVTIIVAVFNGGETLQKCIDSVAAQINVHVELIIIDGGSVDGTVDILQKNQDCISYWESGEDDGIYHAWNKALPHVHGEWVYFLGADDFLWAPDVLEKMMPSLQNAYPAYRVVYGQAVLVNRAHEMLQYMSEPWHVVNRRFKQIMIGLPHQGVMHHKSLFEVHGEFDEAFRIAGDYEFLLRELKDKDALFVPDVTLAAMTLGGISTNPMNSMLVMAECRQAHQKVLDGRNGWRWWFAYCKVVFRLFLWRVLGETMTRRILDVARICVGMPRHWTRS